MGLFDFNPAAQRAAIQQRNRQNDLNYANLPRGRGFVATAAQAGRQIGQGLFGDPEMDKVKKMEMVQQKLLQSGVDFGTPEFFDMAYKELAAAGLQQEALQARIQGQEYLQGQEDRAINNQYKQAQDYSQLNKDGRTTKQKDYEYLLGKGVSEEKAYQAVYGKSGQNINVYPNAQGPQEKKTAAAFEESIVNSSNAYDRIIGIQKSFDPEFLRVGDKIINYFRKGADYLVTLPVSQQAEIQKRAEFMQNAVANLNLYIKEITGAQMSEFEADRLRKAIPDPEKDSPTVFKSKMDNAVHQIKMARARAQYMLKQGIKPTYNDKGEISYRYDIGDIETIIKNRGDALAKSLEGKVPEDQIKSEVLRMLSQEFGI